VFSRLLDLDELKDIARRVDLARVDLSAAPLGGPGRARSHCRFRNRGTEYVSESSMKWMSGGTKRQCDRTLPRARGTASSASREGICLRIAGLLGLPGRLSGLRIFHSNSVLYAAFLWVRRALKSKNGGFRPGQRR
jgi:hypothetical protein